MKNLTTRYYLWVSPITADGENGNWQQMGSTNGYESVEKLKSSEQFYFREESMYNTAITEARVLEVTLK